MSQKRIPWRWTISVALVISLLCSEHAGAKKPPKPEEPTEGYTIVPFMPAGSNSTRSVVGDLNEQGEAVGTLEYADGLSAAVHFDILTDHYTPLTGGDYAHGINNSGQIVGVGGPLGLFWRDRWDEEPITLPPLPGDSLTVGFGINDDGVVIGSSISEEGDDVGVVWRILVTDGVVNIDGPVELPLLYPETPGLDGFSRPWEITEVVEGIALIAGGTGYEAVTWTIAVDTNGGPLAVLSVQAVEGLGPRWSQCYGINNSATVCGLAGGPLPFVDFTGQEPTFLPVPRKTLHGGARDVNDRDEIVGYAAIDFQHLGFPGKDYAQLWRGGERIDLTGQIPKHSGWARLRSATVINNSGVIAGYGWFDVATRGFIMIPNAE